MVTSSFFIFDSGEFGLWAGMYSRLKTSFWARNSYLPVLILEYISLKAKSKSHMNIC